DNPFNGRRGFNPQVTPATFQDKARAGSPMPSFSNRGNDRVNSFAKPQPASYIPRNGANNNSGFRGSEPQRMEPSRFENAPRTTFKPREASYMPPPRQEVKTVAPTVERAPSNNNYRSSMSENRQAPSRQTYSSPSFNRGGGFGGGGHGFGGGFGGGPGGGARRHCAH